MDMDECLMELIVNSGDARSQAMDAIKKSREGNGNEADELIKKAEKTILAAHEVQTNLIQEELNGGNVNMNLLTVHAQDHLMNALTVIDLAKEIVSIYKERKD